MNWTSLVSLRGFDRDLKLLLLSMTTRRVVTGFLQVVSAIYFSLLGFSPLTIGLLASIANVTSAFHHISFGILSDRYGRKPFLLLGSVFATLRLVIFATTQDFWLLALGQGLGAMGEGAGAGQPVVSGYIADKTKPKERVSVFSTLAVTNAIATSVGFAVAGLPQSLQSILGLDLVGAHVPLFSIGIIFSALSFLLFIPITDVRHEERNGEKDKRMPNVKSWSVIGKFSLVRAASGLGWGFIDSLATLYFYLRFAVGSDALGLIFAVERVTSILTYAFIPVTVGRLGEVGTLTWSRILSAVFTVVFILTSWYPLAAFLFIVLRLILMFSMPVRQSFAAGIVDPGETGTTIGISNFARMGVRSAAPTITGYMFESVSLSAPFLIGASLMALSGFLYHIFFRSHQRSDSRTTIR